MRIMPLLSAIIVSVALYALVFEREALLAYAQVATSEEEESVETDTINAVSVVAFMIKTVFTRLASSGAWEVTIDDQFLRWVAPQGIGKSFDMHLNKITCLEALSIKIITTKIMNYCLKTATILSCLLV